MAENDKQLLEALLGMGLSDHEARVYLAALSLGSCTVLQMTRVSGLKRTSVYYVLESLKKQGLLSIEVRGFKQRYVAEHPDKLAGVLDQRRREFRELLPEFAARYNLKGGESTLKYYEGLESIKNIYDALIRDMRPKDDYMVISNSEQWINLDTAFFRAYRARRAKLPVRRRLLLLDNEVGRDFKKFEKNYGEEVKLLPQEMGLTTSLVIIPRRVVIQQLTPPIVAMVIENPSIIQLHQQMFEALWKLVPEQPPVKKKSAARSA